MLTAVLAYLQLVLGAIVRHSPYLLGDSAATIFQVAVYFHIVLAAAVTFHVLWLAVALLPRRRLHGRSRRTWRRSSSCQLLLGASSWLVKYGMPSGRRSLSARLATSIASPTLPARPSSPATAPSAR